MQRLLHLYVNLDIYNNSIIKYAYSHVVNYSFVYSLAQCIVPRYHRSVAAFIRVIAISLAFFHWLSFFCQSFLIRALLFGLTNKQLGSSCSRSSLCRSVSIFVKLTTTFSCCYGRHFVLWALICLDLFNRSFFISLHFFEFPLLFKA